jgi:transposase InsO family protein
VARVMRAHGIAGIRLRRRVRTTIPEPSNQIVPDLLMRDFTAQRPNTTHVGDFQCRRRYWKSYADLRTMPMVLTVVQVSDGRRPGWSA